MTISSIRGLAVNTPAPRTDGVLPGTLPALQRAERFQARLANAGRGYGNRPAANPEVQAAGRQADASRPETAKKRGKTLDGTPAGYNSRTGKQGSAAAREPVARPLPVTAAQRTRRTGKRTLRSARKTVRRLAEVFGLTVVDAWSDPAQKAVTVLVEQDGWADAQFVIRQDDTAWRVTVRTVCGCEAEILRRHEKPLQRRFEGAELGRVTLSCSSDGAISPAMRAPTAC